MQQFRVEACTLLVAVLLFFYAPLAASEPSIPFKSKWPRSSVVVSVSSSFATVTNIQGDVAGSIQRSIEGWTRAGDVSIDAVETDLQSVSPKGVRGDGISLITAASTAENVQLFPNQADSPAAVTRIFTDKRGNITEADIVLNPFVRFSTDGTFGTYDLQAVVTHEIGHLLGLDHSPVWGSVMFAKSGVSPGPAMWMGQRESLPETDASALRALYGARAHENDCCGAVIGRVTGILPTAKHRSVFLWLEELSTGRVVGGTRVLSRGEFELSGLSDGTYRLRIVAEFGEDLVAFDDAMVQVSVGEIVNRNFKLHPENASFTASLFGTSQQLARLPGVYRPGGYQTLFIGGKGLDIAVARISISGTNLSIPRDVFRFSKYGEAVKVINFDLPPGTSLAEGEYTLVIEDNNGVRRFLPGALVIPN